MVRWAVYLIPILFLGCATIEPEPFEGPNGRQAFSMKCSGWGKDIHMCYEKSSELCPSGYQIIDTTEKVKGASTGYGVVVKTHKYLAIECK